MSEAYRLQPAKVPETLTALPQWHIWRFDQTDRGATKVPYQPVRTSNKAQSNNPATWGTFGQALAAQRRGLGGMGFMFTADDGLVGIDFDGCRDPETGQIADWAAEDIRALDTYGEVSPSGTGVKLFLRGKWPFPKGKNKKLSNVPKLGDKVPGVEGYDRGRYFAVTGDKLEGPAEPQERQQQLEAFCNRYWPARTSGKTAGGSTCEKCSTSNQRLDAARKYIDKVEPAVSGSGGHNQTYKVACLLLGKLGLERSDAEVVFREYNARCVPPWSEHDLQHKLDDAWADADVQAERSRQRWDDQDTPYRVPQHWTAEVAQSGQVSESPSESDDDDFTPRLVTRRMSQVTTRKLAHYWQNRFPLGKFSMLSGDPGDGKTLMAIDLTARTTRGSNAPDGTPLPKGRVLFVSCEDDVEDTLKPRLEAAGADPEMVEFLDAVEFYDLQAEKRRQRPFSLQADIPVLEQYLAQGGFVAVFLDTAAGFTGKIDNNSNTDVRGVLAPLVKLAGQYQVAIIGLAHLTKDSAKAARYRTNGSIGWTGMARSVLALGIDPTDKDLRLVAPIKCNLGPKPATLGFRIRSTADDIPYLEWLAEAVDVSADEMLGGSAGGGKQLDEVALWLQGELKSGPRYASELFTAGEVAGHTSKQLRRAKDDLGCTVSKSGNRWTWALPQHAHLAKGASWAPSEKNAHFEGHLDAGNGHLDSFTPGVVGRFTIDAKREGSQIEREDAHIESQDSLSLSMYSTEGAQGDRSGSGSAWDAGIDPAEAGL